MLSLHTVAARLQHLSSILMEILDVLMNFHRSALKVGHFGLMFTHLEFQKCKLFPQTRCERVSSTARGSSYTNREKLLLKAAKNLSHLCVRST